MTELEKAQLRLYRRQSQWEVPKAVAMLLLAGAVFLGFVLAASTWLHPAPQQIVVQFQQPLAVKVQP